MPYYIDIVNGRLVKTLKRGRPRRQYRHQIKPGMWAAKPVRVFQAEKAYPLTKITSWLVSSHVQRAEDGSASFFLCNISPSCQLRDLRLFDRVNRVDADISSGSLLIWEYEYQPDQPDAVIEGAVDVKPCKTDIS